MRGELFFRVFMPAALIVLLAGAAASAATDSVDDYVRREMQRQRIPGLSLAVTREGKVVKAMGYGLANVEQSVPASPETVYQSGSVGKQFTAIAVMMLVEEGKVALDDSIARYFQGGPQWWTGVTVRHLLTHTSGMKDWGDPEIDLRKDYTEQELLKIAMSLPPDFVPGSQWSYSNTGYVLLGILIHQLSGRFYGDFLKERVFAPLGMASTRVISEADIVPRRAAGYRLEKDQLKNQAWVSPSLNTTADGALYLTVLDLAKWDAALWAQRLLKPSSYMSMWTPARLSSGATHPYGFGWSLAEQRGQPTIEHGGSWQGFRASIVHYPEARLGVIVLSNLAQGAPEQIAHGVAGLVAPALTLPDPRAARVPDPDPRRTAAVRAVLEAWGQGEVSDAMASALRATQTGTEREKTSRKRTTERLAKLTSFSFLAEDDVASRGFERRGEMIQRIIHYGLRSADEVFAYRFYLNAAGQVADFSAEQR